MPLIGIDGSHISKGNVAHPAAQSRSDVSHYSNPQEIGALLQPFSEGLEERYNMLINLTPHVIRVLTDSGNYVDIPPDGRVPRLPMETKFRDKIPSPDGSIEVHAVLYRAVQDLPEPVPDTFYIVSQLICKAANRADLVYPDSGPTAIRDTSGQVAGVRRFLV